MIDRITELRAQYRNKLLKKYDLGGGKGQKGSEDNPYTLEYDNPEDRNISFWDKITHPKTMIFNQFGAYSEEDRKPAEKTTTFENPAKGAINTTGDPNSLYQIPTFQGLGKTTIYKPGSDEEKMAKGQEKFQSTFTMGSDPIKKNNSLSEQDRLQQLSLLLNTPAGDMSTNFYNFGRALGMKSGTKGRGMLGVGSLGAGLLSAARMTASGVGYSKANTYAQKYMRDNLIKNQNQYTAASETENNNYTGGMAEFGGKFNERMKSFREGGFFHFAEGGEQEGEDEMMQIADNGNPGEVQQQNPQEEKIIQIAQQLVNGLGSLEAIDAYLREQEVDEQMYGAIMHIAEQMLGESEQEEDQEEEMPEEEQEEPEMNEGGEFNKNVGDFIEFEYEGKKYSGKISKIENGQIYL